MKIILEMTWVRKPKIKLNPPRRKTRKDKGKKRGKYKKRVIFA